MPLSGAGVYSAPASSWNPAIDNTDVDASDWIALLADLTTALSTAMYKDGQQTVTANIPLGGFKLTGLGAASANGDALRYEQRGGTLATEQASTSGTSIDFTGIPSGVKRITIMFVGVSTNGTSNPIIQIGPSGGPETSGYLGTGATLTATPGVTNYTTGFGVRVGSASAIMHGSIVLTLERASTFMWVANGTIGLSDSAEADVVAGRKALAAELTQVRITTVNGTDAFDAGLINLSYE